MKSDKHSGLQLQLLSFVGRPEVAEVVEGHSYRRELNTSKLLVDQPLQVILGAETDVTCGLNFVPFHSAQSSHVSRYRLLNVGSPCGDEGCWPVPVSTVNGATASISFFWYG